MKTQDDDDAVVQRTVAAEGAAKVQTAAPNSVWALGGEGASQPPVPMAPPPARKLPRGRACGDDAPSTRCLKCIESCGPLSAAQLAEAMGVGRAQAAKVADYLSGKNGGGRLVRATGVGGVRIYRLPEQGPAAAEAKGRLERLDRSGRPGLRLKGQGAGAAPALAPGQVPDADAVFGVLSTGELLIELPYLKARMKLGHWMELRDYLARVQLTAAR